MLWETWLSSGEGRALGVMENSPQKENGLMDTVPAVAKHEDLSSDLWHPQKIRCYMCVILALKTSQSLLLRHSNQSMYTGLKRKTVIVKDAWPPNTHACVHIHTRHRHTIECSQRTLTHWLLVCFPTPFCSVVVEVCMRQGRVFVEVTVNCHAYLLGVRIWPSASMPLVSDCTAIQGETSH